MRHYIYSNELNSLAVSIQDFLGKLLIKYDLGNLSLVRWFIEKYSSLLQSQYLVLVIVSNCMLSK